MSLKDSRLVLSSCFILPGNLYFLVSLFLYLSVIFAILSNNSLFIRVPYIPHWYAINSYYIAHPYHARPARAQERHDEQPSLVSRRSVSSPLKHSDELLSRPAVSDPSVSRVRHGTFFTAPTTRIVRAARHHRLAQVPVCAGPFSHPEQVPGDSGEELGLS